MTSATNLPNFLVIGAAKAGTSSLCYYIQQHDDVFITSPKETKFFCYDDHYSRGLDWYASYYRGGASSKFRGEGSVYYAMNRTFPHVFERIRGDLPSLKLIYMVRNPIERMESFYSQEINDGRPSIPFVKAVREREIYVDASLYFDHWERYSGAYGSENVLVIFFEDFRENPAAAVRKALEFLGAETSQWSFDEKVINSREGHREDRVSMQLLRKFPGSGWVLANRRKFLPERVLSVLKSLLRRRSELRAQWDEVTLDWAIAQVGKDTADFLAAMGKPADYWGDLSDRPTAISSTCLTAIESSLPVEDGSNDRASTA